MKAKSNEVKTNEVNATWILSGQGCQISHRESLKRRNFNEEKVLATDLVFSSQFYLESWLGKWFERFMKFEEFEEFPTWELKPSFHVYKNKQKPQINKQQKPKKFSAYRT